jgi:hypothetical protein
MMVQANEDFKSEVHSELDDIRRLFIQHQNTTNPSTTLTSPQVSSSTNNQVVSSSYSVSSNSSSTTYDMNSRPTSPFNSDTQTQMMKLLTYSFSKLYTVLADKQMDTKTDWPKFAGDSKIFRAWYLAIMAQMSLPPWQELYDFVLMTTNTQLNGKLYAKLLIALEGSALQGIVSRKHLRANGLLLLQELVQTYKPKNVPELIAAKTSEFWGNTKSLPYETIDSYYNCFQEILEELSGLDEPISTKSAIRHIIFTLSTEFESIQHNYCIGNLPSQWMTQDWPTLLVLCQDYYNSVKPQGVIRKDSSTDSTFELNRRK